MRWLWTCIELLVLITHVGAKSASPVATGPTGGYSSASAPAVPKKLGYLENMIAGGISRSTAQVVCHPLNVAKTLLQAQGTVTSLGALRTVFRTAPRTFTRGIAAQMTLSLPNGAINFATLELARSTMTRAVPLAAQRSIGPALDMTSSACGTLLASVVSVPQTVLLDRIMAGHYPNLVSGAVTLAKSDGVRGFYRGWTPAMGSKLPSYALNWALFQQLKNVHRRVTKREYPSSFESFLLGAFSSTCIVCLMIPMDTVKTRLTTQSFSAVQYKGIIDCYRTVIRDEGVGALYRSLPPRLVSVVPLNGIQFCVYESVCRILLARKHQTEQAREEGAAGARLAVAR